MTNVSSIFSKISRLVFQPNSKERPPFTVRESDVFIVSYPKSGNTWVRFIIANLLSQDQVINFRNIEDIVPDIHKSLNNIPQMKGRRIMKYHEPFFEYFPNTIYIVRDGRDALVSYYHYNMDSGQFQGTFDDFLKSDIYLRFGSWQDHVTRAMEQRLRYPDRILFIRYEDMLSDLPGNIRKIAKYCGIPLTEELVHSTADKCSFQALQQNERTYGSETLDKKINFFRKGTKEQWKDYFNAEEAVRFVEASRELLMANGYRI
ncbi:MAG: hypothetical protein RL021_2144 [Bacteroidota bacterium]|jgi:hypothetical protein